MVGDLELGLVSDSEFFDAFRKTFNNSLTDNEIKDAWNSFLIGVSEDRLNLLKRLSKKYRIFLLSNTSKIHHEFWDKMFVFDDALVGANYFFEQVHCSYMHHVAKPNQKAFLNVINGANLEPEETWFFDDSIANCKAADELGLKTIYVKNTDDVLGFDWQV